MTDWVDDLVSKLSDAQRQENAARAHALLSARLIAERGPDFFSHLVEEARTQADELNAKLGATIGDVTFKAEGNNFSIATKGREATLSVVVTANLASHQIEVRSSHEGPQHSGDAVFTRYPIIVSKLDHLGVEFDAKNVQHTPRGVVSNILRAQFKPDVLIPR